MAKFNFITRDHAGKSREVDTSVFIQDRFLYMRFYGVKGLGWCKLPVDQACDLAQHILKIVKENGGKYD